MEETKIQFSPLEIELLCNQEIILTKNKAIEKIKRLLETLQASFQFYIEKRSLLAQNEIFSIHPKISRGENYLGLPYLILDYPRCFQQQDIFAIRTMFWWGNFYSTTLHLSGKFRAQFINKIEDAFNFLSHADYYIGINPDPWMHHFEEDNYLKLSTLNKKQFVQMCSNNQHLKIAINTAIDNNGLEEKLANRWQELAKICFG